jgi:DNA/RNA-binding domain of Phe-tRNA-synthetase-like protein
MEAILHVLLISTTDEWRGAHPESLVGLLELSGIENRHASSKLDERKRQTETALGERYLGFARQDFLALPVMSAYEQYYKRFNKTYHVQLQLESIVLKGKRLPNVSPLVDANFVAEVETLVLTAGHDASKLVGPVCMDASREGDQIVQMSGAFKTIRAGDMIMRDANGVCCSVLYGQDNRSPISPQTSHVLYVAYAPKGVPAQSVEDQLRKIEENTRLFSPKASVQQHRLLSA